MRFTFGPPPSALSFDDIATGDWHRLRQPPFWAIYLLTLLVGAAIASAILVAWAVMTPDVDIDFGDAAWVIVVGWSTLLLGTLAQIAAYPGGFRDAILGIWASRITVYTGYAGELSRARHLLELSLPFLLLSMGPLLFVTVTRLQSGWLIYVSGLAAFVFSFNAVLALSAAWQMPAHARVRCVRLQPYWRVPPA